MKILGDEIPEDIFIEIMLRVRAPDILRFRVLSKFHRVLIDSPDFIRKHYLLAAKRTTARQSYVLIMNWYESQNENTSEWCFWMEFESAYEAELDCRVYADHPLLQFDCNNLVGCCMGIVCYTLVYPPDFLFWNPTTRRHRKVVNQNRDIGNQRYFLGYDNVAEDMKLLGTKSYGAEKSYVYSSRTQSWKQVQGFKNRWPNLQLGGGSDVFVEGTNCVHIPAFDSELYKIVAFDFSTESFFVPPLPPGAVTPEGSVPFLPVCFCGCLCLYSCKELYPGAPFEVWMMKEYGVGESWTKIFSVMYSPRTHSGHHLLRPFDLMNNGRQLLVWSSSPGKERGFFIYDDDEKTYKINVTFKGFQFEQEPEHFAFTPSIRLP